MEETHPHHQKKVRLATIILIACLILFSLYLVLQPHLRSAVSRPLPTPSPVSSQNIMLFSPIVNGRVSQDFTIRGKARGERNIVLIRVSQPFTKKMLVFDYATTTATQSGAFGDFAHTVHLTGNRTIKPGDDLLVEVFQERSADGNEINKVTIPVQFTPSQ